MAKGIDLAKRFDTEAASDARILNAIRELSDDEIEMTMRIARAVASTALYERHGPKHAAMRRSVGRDAAAILWSVYEHLDSRAPKNPHE